MAKPILCIDFDGVIHTYTTPWTVAHEIHDTVTEGFFEWAKEAEKYFQLVVYSSRSKVPEAVAAMRLWVEREYVVECGDLEGFPEFEFSAVKPAAFMTIDDRAICFEGDWTDPKLSPATIRNFKPWNKR